jgi:membrane associated rhomboid family serine protease
MNEEKRKILQSLIFPAILVVTIWIVKIVEVTFDIDLSVYGLIPLNARGLIGIITSPFLHEGFAHLFGNSVPLFLLGALLFYFYRELAWRILLLIYLITGVWVWVFARGNGIHIGASGVVYGLAAFLFLSGILRREGKLMSITLLIAFLYGGMVWGVFPQFFPREHISWESHLMGLLAGTILAVYYRKTGPQRIKYDWEDDEDDDTEPGDSSPDDPAHSMDSTGNADITYHYKKDP